jgi:hypothetical protein
MVARDSPASLAPTERRRLPASARLCLSSLSWRCRLVPDAIAWHTCHQDSRYKVG